MWGANGCRIGCWDEYKNGAELGGLRAEFLKSDKNIFMKIAER